MSVFDGFAEAMASVPPTELRFSFGDLQFLFEVLNHYQLYLDERDEDEQPEEYVDDGRSYSTVLHDMWKMLMQYKFH